MVFIIANRNITRQSLLTKVQPVTTLYVEVQQVTFLLAPRAEIMGFSLFLSYPQPPPCCSGDLFGLLPRAPQLTFLLSQFAQKLTYPTLKSF